ncbi:protoporphyrinogen oxidase [Aeromicrobium terrae]|uniref:Coproporphyrinogen III oxidase n=1 Tax=Aeromicrobium terrae TaxID=2498846 RepID=A0A5C8NM40_9ACTN|nr:protoporphyrinogen oxidase [Aeromicrobium terrae]
MRVAVVGGGIAGLTAAFELSRAGVDTVLLEGSDRIGGKLRREDVGGVTLDVGAEAMLQRRPEALDLSRQAGIGEHLVDAATTQASIWSRGELHRLPRTVMGVPAEPVDFVTVEQRSVAVPDEDISVAEYVSERAGTEVLDRLVEPLLGGVYAGHADALSLASAGAQLKALGPDPLAAAAATTPTPGPVFAGLVGGVGRLPEAVTTAIADEVDIRLGTVVRGLSRSGTGWDVVTSRGTEQYDAVVVAAPAPASGRILAEAAPEAAFELADFTYASVAIVTFVIDADVELPGSGFLVPPVDGTAIKGATFSSNKWAWLAELGRTVLRASVGRAGETTLLHSDDATVADAALADLRAVVGGLPDPAAWHVQRWGGALPQYEVGHLDRVAVIDRAVAAVPGLEVCGAAYRGVGIPAVIASAREAVSRLLSDLGH